MEEFLKTHRTQVVLHSKKVLFLPHGLNYELWMMNYELQMSNVFIHNSSSIIHHFYNPSYTTAAPCPTPTHIVANPYFTFSLFISCNKVVEMRTPLQPKG